AQHTIPLPQFKLPAKRTHPLNLPMTAGGEVDVDALIKEVDQEQRQPSLSPRSLRAPYRENVILPPLEAADTIGELRAVRKGIVSEAGDGAADLAGQDDGAEDDVGSLAQEQGEREDLVTSLRRVVTESARARPVRPRVNGNIRTMSGRRRLLWSSAAAAALLVVAVAVWVGVSASALGITLPKHSTQPTPTATVTVAPTATSTATTIPTATATSQQALNQEAAAAFRAVTLSHFQDHGCSAANASKQFIPGQTLYINVCTAAGALPGPMTISLRQNGSVIYVVVRDVTLSPGQSYSFYWYGFSDGTYDALVTLTISGQTATARDLPFTFS
ncbi:MAG TPA: hypothetical protein VGS80_02225, partial [Ktedonobacterales bacterium]|nr:hypothetical protein [Ktedonobacterales bacterium]